MQAYPHHYKATAAASAVGHIRLDSKGLPGLETAAPAEFGGPGDLWSPETLLVGSIADCYILTFKAIARASKLDWQTLECKVNGVLDRVDNVTRFTRYEIHARLTVPEGTDEHKAKHLLEKSESVCLITNSLTGEKALEMEVVFN